MAELEIRNLYVRAGEKEILRGLDLSVGKGEIHALMGPNGSGKSTLAYVLAGRPGYEVREGSVTFTANRHPGLEPGPAFLTREAERRFPDQVRDDDRWRISWPADGRATARSNSRSKTR